MTENTPKQPLPWETQRCPRCGKPTNTIFFDVHPQLDGQCADCYCAGWQIRWRHVIACAVILLAIATLIAIL